MTNRFAGAFDPPTPGSTLTPPAQSVQSSLYQRLKKSHGNKSGVIGWMLVRLAQPLHSDHVAAWDMIAGLDIRARSGLLLTVRKTQMAPAIAARADAVKLAEAIVDALLAMSDADLRLAPVVPEVHPQRKAATHVRIRNVADGGKANCPVGPGLDARLASGEWVEA